MWEMFRVVEHEVVHADGLYSICSAVVYQHHLLLSLQSSDDPYFRQDFAEDLNRSRFCWFCRFLCRVVARASLPVHLTRCLKETLPLKVVSGQCEYSLLLSVNTMTPTVLYVIEIDSRSAKLESGAFVDLWYYGVMTCQTRLLSHP